MRLLLALLTAMLPLAAAGEAPATALAQVPAPAKAAAPAPAPAAPEKLPDFELLKARLPAGEFEALIERTGRCDLVCHADPITVRDDGTADCRVKAVLKGSVQGETIRVRFAKTFGSAWPQKGVDAIYFLKALPPARAGLFSGKLPTYQLLPEAAGLAAPNETRLAVVRLAAKGLAALIEAPKAAPLDMPAPDSLEGMTLDAVYVALGAIQEVSLPEPRAKSADSSAILAFRAEQVLKGDLPPGVIYVYVPAARPEFIGPGLKPLVPKVGAAALFFRPEKQGGSYRLLSPYRGYVTAANAEELGRKVAPAMTAAKRLNALGLIGNTGGHDSVADTLKTWMDAWNTQTDIEKLVACYSRRSQWRQKWESGLEARLELAKTMATYPGKITVVCDRIEEKGQDTVAAAVRIQVMVTDPAAKTDTAEVRSVEMTLVRENGQWLILDEGN
jgi:hypothetical protein